MLAAGSAARRAHSLRARLDVQDLQVVAGDVNSSHFQGFFLFSFLTATRVFWNAFPGNGPARLFPDFYVAIRTWYHAILLRKIALVDGKPNIQNIVDVKRRLTEIYVTERTYVAHAFLE